jgi:Ca-activated chloride channel homolog
MSSLYLKLLLSAMFGVLLSIAGESHDASRFQVNVDMVQLRTTVTDGAGRHVRDLTAQDFHVFENGVEQKIQNVVTPAHSETTPTAVYLLFDTSDRMYSDFVFAEDAVAGFIRRLDGSDFVAVSSFSRNVRRLATVSRDRLTVLSGLRRATLGDDTSLYDGLLLTLRDAATFRGSKAVVVFSNGPDTSSMLTPDNVRQVAEDEGIPIYLLSTRSYSPSANAMFCELTETTGGKTYFANTWAGQKLAFESIGEDLNASYVISYYPESRDTAYRKVDVRVAGDAGHSYRVRARAGYRPVRITPASE